MSFDWSNVKSAKEFSDQHGFQNKFCAKSSKTVDLFIKTTALMGECLKFNLAMEEAIAEQNEYILEIEDFEKELYDLQKDYQEDVEDLVARQEELLEKEVKGTITEEEKAELAGLQDQMDGLDSDILNNSKAVEGKIQVLSKNATDQIDKAAIARDYARTTESTAKDLLESKNNSSQKLYDNAVKVSSELMDSANTYAKNKNFFLN